MSNRQLCAGSSFNPRPAALLRRTRLNERAAVPKCAGAKELGNWRPMGAVVGRRTARRLRCARRRERAPDLRRSCAARSTLRGFTPMGRAPFAQDGDGARPSPRRDLSGLSGACFQIHTLPASSCLSVGSNSPHSHAPIFSGSDQPVHRRCSRRARAPSAPSSAGRGRDSWTHPVANDLSHQQRTQYALSRSLRRSWRCRPPTGPVQAAPPRCRGSGTPPAGSVRRCPPAGRAPGRSGRE